MESTLDCIINDSRVSARVNPGIVLLDFLRKHEHLTGTKEGCREGDCGACTVLVGELHGTAVKYKSVNSCLLPLGDVQGKHVVTVEGINQPSGLNPIQQAFVEEGGTQCGFCTPGFIISLTGYCMNDAQPRAERESGGRAQVKHSEADALTAVDGNICRCTGHTPIKKAIRRITQFLSLNSEAGGSPLEHLAAQKILPEYFLTIASRLSEIQTAEAANVTTEETALYIVSGGTDLYVQRAFTMHAEPIKRISTWRTPAEITEDADAIHIPGTTTIEEFRTSPVIGTYFPELETQLLMFGSTPIRNRGTVGGNLANGSPIGDMTCLFMALDAVLTLQAGDSIRNLPLRKFYTGYKQMDKRKEELIAAITIGKPAPTHRLSYEKVSRRQYLDIASVNSTMAFDLQNGRMTNVGISAGGVGPTMLHLEATSKYLCGSIMNAAVFAEAAGLASQEISPISDARGSAGYKRLLLRQLLAAHVMKYFPGVVTKEVLA